MRFHHPGILLLPLECSLEIQERCAPRQILLGAHRPYHVLAAKLLFDESSCPPRLHCSHECGLKTAAFAMPDWGYWKEDKTAIEWCRLHVTGVCKLSGDSGSQDGLYVYFCSCNEAGQNAWNMCELFGFCNARVCAEQHQEQRQNSLSWLLTSSPPCPSDQRIGEGPGAPWLYWLSGRLDR